MTKQEIIEMIERAGFEAVETVTVYNPSLKCEIVYEIYV
jgi:2-iminoacetate synthase ThiH